ncbi:TPA: hypothetical protein ACX6PK_003439 [Photobacterium damselae]
MNKELIKQAIEALELIDIYVYSSSVNRHHDIYFDSYPEEMEQQDKLGVEGYRIESDDTEYKMIRAKIKLGSRFIERKTSEIEDDVIDVLAEIEANFIAEYSVHGEVSEESLREFMKYNAVHNVWPFWREFAFRNASEAKLPRPIIPLMSKGKR